MVIIDEDNQQEETNYMAMGFNPKMGSTSDPNGSTKLTMRHEKPGVQCIDSQHIATSGDL